MDKEEAQMIIDALKDYDNKLWDLANAIFMGKDFADYYMKRYEKYKIIKEIVLEFVKRETK